MNGSKWTFVHTYANHPYKDAFFLFQVVKIMNNEAWKAWTSTWQAHCHTLENPSPQFLHFWKKKKKLKGHTCIKAIQKHFPKSAFMYVRRIAVYLLCILCRLWYSWLLTLAHLALRAWDASVQADVSMQMWKKPRVWVTRIGILTSVSLCSYKLHHFCLHGDFKGSSWSQKASQVK